MVNENPKYLLDTDICIMMIKDKGNIRKQVIKAGMSNCYVSDITIAELYYGAFKSERREHFEDVAFVVNHFEILPIYPSLEVYGNLKYTLEKAGTPIADFDLLIGATAVNNGLKMVTNNKKHFSRIPGIDLVYW